MRPRVLSRIAPRWRRVKTLQRLSLRFAVHRAGVDPYAHTFAYDSVGNRLVKNADSARTTSVYDAANQSKTSKAVGGTTTYTFDADGNQQIVEEPGGGRTTTTCNYENQPTLTVKPDASRITTTYNADNRRVQLDE